jgi:uncharacterized protein YaaW (UPF0174 family)
VPYPEVAWDVAETLRGVFEDRTYAEGNVAECERFVLGKMKVASDDLEQLCAAVAATGTAKAAAAATARAAGGATARAAAQAAARVAAQKIGEAAARRALAEAGKEVSKRVAKKAAEEVGKRVAAQVLAQIGRALNLISVVLLLVTLAGPAKRVTIPGVVYVALLRKLCCAAHGE